MRRKKKQKKIETNQKYMKYDYDDRNRGQQYNVGEQNSSDGWNTCVEWKNLGFVVIVKSYVSIL